jgi:uncharacterized damage-inducible protein DinB
MSDTAAKLAEKLTTEGEKTLAFFRALPDGVWTQPVFADGAQWDVQHVFEHLCMSEHTLRRLFEQILATGQGAEEGFDVNAFNEERTGRFDALSRDELLNLYAETRAKTVAFARGLTDEQLARRGRHPALGDSTLEEQLKLIYLHHTMHMRDVKKALAA